MKSLPTRVCCVNGDADKAMKNKRRIKNIVANSNYSTTHIRNTKPLRNIDAQKDYSHYSLLRLLHDALQVDRIRDVSAPAVACNRPQQQFNYWGSRGVYVRNQSGIR